MILKRVKTREKDNPKWELFANGTGKSLGYLVATDPELASLIDFEYSDGTYDLKFVEN